MSSLRINTVINAVGQIYNMLIGFVMTPFFIKYLGAEAFGLVSFFTLLTSWMNLLDLGMTPTLIKEVASSRSSNDSMIEFAKLLRSFEVIFFAISILIIVVLYFFSTWLSNDWIKSIEILPVVIAKCISIIGLLVALRWFSSLYKSVLIGLEKHVALNLINISFSTIKFGGVFILFYYFSTNIYVFFVYQLIFGIIEFFILLIFTYKNLRFFNSKLSLFSFYSKNVKGVAKFAFGIAYTSSIWIFVSQLDKLVLSGILNLKEYGYFTLVASLSAIIPVLGIPITQVLLPRMIYLYSINEIPSLIKIYRNSSQLITLVCFSASIVISLFSEEIIFCWTGSREAAIWSKDILFWYSLGNAALVISSAQYFLQVAYGELKLHILGGTLTLLIDVPLIVLTSIKFGPHSTSIVWFVLRVFWLLLWTTIIHRKYLPDLQFKWLFNDVFIIIITVCIVALFMKIYFPTEVIESRLMLMQIFCFGFLLLVVSSLSSRFIRSNLVKYIQVFI